LKSRVAHWDPHELANKIKEQVDFDQLLKDKIISHASLETFEITAFHDYELFTPQQMQNQRALNYVKQNPIDIGDLGFKNLAVQRLLREENRERMERQNTLNFPQTFRKLPPEQQRRSLQFM